MSTSLIDQLAVLAHQSWCLRKQHEGWRPGQRYNPDLRTHDAIKSFEQLDARDQQHARTAAEASGVLSILGRSIEYPRGAEVSTPLGDLVIGQHVRLICSDRVEGLEIRPEDVGMVLHVKRDESGHNTKITVGWPSGDRTVHSLGDDDLLAISGS